MDRVLVDSFPPVEPADVDALERRLGVRLPSDYREFLLRRNGGDFVRLMVFPTLDPPGEAEPSLRTVLACTDDETWSIEKRTRERATYPHGWVSIGIGGDNTSTVGILADPRQGQSYGNVYYYEAYTPVEDDEDRLVLAARSFSEFWNSLEIWEPEPDPDEVTDVHPAFQAVADGDVDRLGPMLDAGLDPNTTFSTGDLLLAKALLWPNVAGLLLARGADVHHVDGRGNQPIDYSRSFVDSARLLLEYGADPNHVDSAGCPVLHKWDGSLRTLELLLKFGADPNAQGPDGETALSLLCDLSRFSNFKRSFQLLREFGAKVEPAVEYYVRCLNRHQRSADKALAIGYVDRYERALMTLGKAAPEETTRTLRSMTDGGLPEQLRATLLKIVDRIHSGG